MTTALRLLRSAASSRFLLPALVATSLSLIAPAALTLEVPIEECICSGDYPALGIADEFGRWDTTVRLIYDPDGAPSTYDTAKVRSLTEEAFESWTTVSGIKYEWVGTATAAADDRAFGKGPNDYDGFVRISWESMVPAGRAGPLKDFYDPDLGYYPFIDGTIELNKNTGVITSDEELTAVLVHEIGHLLGLGHSDNPVSVMYSNPYNHLRYPREDDIRAVQVLYGQPPVAFDPASQVSVWRFNAPPPASSGTTQFLFKPNSAFNVRNGGYFESEDLTISQVTSNTSSAEAVWFWGVIGGSSISLNVNATFIVVDPGGYVYDREPMNLSCGANRLCWIPAFVSQGRILKTYPGEWQIYVVDEAANQTLFSATLPVITSMVYNRPPQVTLTATAGPSPTHAVFTVTANDPESDGMEVVWHPPGLSGFPQDDLRNTFNSGGSVSRTFDFSMAGSHVFYIEVRDDQPRYSSEAEGFSVAGEGFQTLLRVTVTVPGAAMQVVSTADTGTSIPSQQVLSAIAANAPPPNTLVANFAGFNATSSVNIGFTYGASSDQGATTRTAFKPTDNAIIAGGIKPQSSDLGKEADVFIVVRTTVGGVDNWTYRNGSGVFVPWPSVAISQLQPAYSVGSLQSSQSFLVYSGRLVAAQHRIYIGYRVARSSTVFYTGQALNLNVAN